MAQQSLSLASALEKHRIASEHPWYVLLDFTPNDADPATVIRLVRNPEDVVYAGNTYSAFNFNLADNELSSNGQIPQLKLQISNVNRLLTGYLELYGGGVGAKVVLTIVSAADLANPVFVDEFLVMGADVDSQWVTFTLGAPNPMRQQFPKGVYIQSHCGVIFNTPAMQAANDPAGLPCGYQGAAATCSRLLEGSNGCRAKANQARFAGFPGILTNGARNAI